MDDLPDASRPGDIDRLIYPIFELLRREGLPLGVSEYLLAVQALRAGFGVEGEESLKELLCLLWAKRREDREDLERAFLYLVKPRLAKPGVADSVEVKEPTTPLEERPGPEARQPSSLEEEPGPPPTPAAATPQPAAPTAGQPAPAQELTAPARQTPPASAPVESGPLARRVEIDPAFFPFEGPEVDDDGSPAVRQRYHLSPRPPLDLREMATAWRHFRRALRSGPPEELDVPATIADYCHNGVVLRPHLAPRRRNQASLLALIDQAGSMTPYSLLSKTLVESIQRGGRLNRVSVYYFHNDPSHALFADPRLTGKRFTLREVLSNEAAGRSVLIFSDAGAARGNYDTQRLESTRAFLRRLRQHTYLYAWLNPLPPRRWAGTTAEKIAGLAPMYALDRDGLSDAVAILRGQPFPAHISLDVHDD
jgi:hypothetical protein